MITLNVIIAFLYAAIIVGYLWARLKFFQISPSTPKHIASFYDPAVLIHIAVTCYFFYDFDTQHHPFRVLICIALLSSSLFLFWWSILTAKTLGFASTSEVKEMLATGPYAIIRHPFYTSYSFTWIGTSILFNSLILWFTLLYLLAFYYRTATVEEKIILKSAYSREYEIYRQKVGMFLPRIYKWKI